MTFDELKSKIAQLQSLCDQSAGQHNINMGRLLEAKDMLATMEKQSIEALKAAHELDGSQAVPTDVSEPQAAAA